MSERLAPMAALTDVAGFQLGTASCGLKQDRPDLLLVHNTGPAPSAAAVFTQNAFAAAPIHVSRQHMDHGDIRGLVVNAGLANACTGRQGLRDALTMARTSADALGAQPEQMLVASTGIIGRRLPMDQVTQGIWDAADGLGNSRDAARAILTTDSGPKTIRRDVEMDGRCITISGFAKGSGMIHPNMATMLAFVLTDAPVDADFLQDTLRRATTQSFNQISVDADPSTNDMAAIMASGAAGGAPITSGTPEGDRFQSALIDVCQDLAKQIAADGEGASRFLEVQVDGAANDDDARTAARSVVSSFLVKAALHGADANWGRVLAAIGSTNVAIDTESVRLIVESAHGSCTLLEDGAPTNNDASPTMDAAMVRFHLQLGAGTGAGTAWGCDVSTDSVSFNATKTT